MNQELGENQVVTRACMSNLIIYCDDDEQTLKVNEALPRIVSAHPCRVILLTGLGHTGEPGLDVFVSGLYSKLSSGLQVSAELIRVIADASARKRLAPVARAHLVGDLPTTLWWASLEPAPPLAKPSIRSPPWLTRSSTTASAGNPPLRGCRRCHAG
ncbi:MAG: glucose-6-phosphate dehydrogenase assembly protein OpcA [Candidatus Thiothrix singaporensis]|uniref:Glucose-6-phosphate dehydrogenase assembly protein OpcA n=1 Tax=Candidatus Thiothrix singaporensis TaxID=2799669 RepID=A0A7L6ATD7_9GAMM|nr:MAG: glucose-6-phosphate dehydrogenase assembly protein OpcA [Candidatus Thiothrix singaporensis]